MTDNLNRTTINDIDEEHRLTLSDGSEVALYAGLLDLAHRKGLTSISTCTGECLPYKDGFFCVARADASFITPDFHYSFSGIASAWGDPTLVGVPEAHPFALAETRAKARALRDALNFQSPVMEDIEAGRLDLDKFRQQAGAKVAVDKGARAEERAATVQQQLAETVPVPLVEFVTDTDAVKKFNRRCKEMGIDIPNRRKWLMWLCNEPDEDNINRNLLAYAAKAIELLPEVWKAKAEELKETFAPKTPPTEEPKSLPRTRMTLEEAQAKFFERMGIEVTDTITDIPTYANALATLLLEGIAPSNSAGGWNKAANAPKEKWQVAIAKLKAGGEK